MEALFEMRIRDTLRFAQFLGRYEGVLYPILRRYGWWGSPASAQGWIDAFDTVNRRWMDSRSVPQTDEVILAALPNRTGFIGRRSQYQAALRDLEANRALQTIRNIAGGPVGTLGYLLGGDGASDVGSVIDGAMRFRGRLQEARDQFKALSQSPVYRPDAAMIATARGPRGTESSGTDAPVGGVAGTRPLSAMPASPAKPIITPPVGGRSDSAGGRATAPDLAAPKTGSTSKGSPGARASSSGASVSGTSPSVGRTPDSPAASAGSPPRDKIARYIQSFKGRLQDPSGALRETFRRTVDENRLHARAATPELAAIQRYLSKGFRGLGGRTVAQLVAVKPLSRGRAPDFIVVYSDGFAHRLEVSTVTSAASRGPELKARGKELVAPTVDRAPLQANFENRLNDKGVAVPGKKPLQLSVAHPAAGPGGALIIFAHSPTPGAESMARNAIARMGPKLSPQVWRVEFGLWSRNSPADKLTRAYLVFERQPDGTYPER